MAYLCHYYEPDNNTKLILMQKRAKVYQIIDNELYKTSFIGPLLHCLSKAKDQELLSEIHAGVYESQHVQKILHRHVALSHIKAFAIVALTVFTIVAFTVAPVLPLSWFFSPTSGSTFLIGRASSWSRVSPAFSSTPSSGLSSPVAMVVSRSNKTSALRNNTNKPSCFKNNKTSPYLHHLPPIIEEPPIDRGFSTNGVQGG
jgi:hypothetical protein